MPLDFFCAGRSRIAVVAMRFVGGRTLTKRSGLRSPGVVVTNNALSVLCKYKCITQSQCQAHQPHRTMIYMADVQAACLVFRGSSLVMFFLRTLLANILRCDECKRIYTTDFWLLSDIAYLQISLCVKSVSQIADTVQSSLSRGHVLNAEHLQNILHVVKAVHN